MKKGMIFDLYQDGEETRRVMAINDSDVVCLDSLLVITDIDFENEAGIPVIKNILNYQPINEPDPASEKIKEES